MKKIDALLFDLGGVLIDVDYHKTIDAFAQLGVQNPSSLYNQFGQNQLFDQYEKGEVSSKFFVEQLKPLTKNNTSESDIVTAWNAMIGDFPNEKLDFIAELSQHNPCFLLSNTNEIHLKKAIENLQKTAFKNLDELFIKCYYSHIIGKRKPEIETFKWVIDQMGLQPNKVLFIDDSPQHIEGAKKAGLQVIYYKEASDLFSIRDLVNFL